MNDPRLTIGLLLIIVLFLIAILLVLLMIRRRSGAVDGSSPSDRYDRSYRRGPAPGAVSTIRGAAAGAVQPCPICGTMLKKGERVKSAVYTGTPDSIAHIFGCIYCYPPNSEYSRICPVCRKEVAEDGYIVARMFDGKEKKHVHVLGCTGCRRVR